MTKITKMMLENNLNNVLQKAPKIAHCVFQPLAMFHCFVHLLGNAWNQLQRYKTSVLCERASIYRVLTCQIMLLAILGQISLLLLLSSFSSAVRNLPNFSRFGFPSNNHFSLSLQHHVDFVENERVKKLWDCQKPHQLAQRHFEFWHFQEGISTFKP